MNKQTSEKYIIESEDSNQRIDSFLSNIYPDLSRSFIQKQIKLENVKLVNSPVKSSYILKTDDIVTVEFNIENEYKIEPENISLDIKYEDNSMLIVNKPTGMLSHPSSVEKTGTLVNALLYKYHDNLSNCNGSNRPGIVHRLDRNTSGLLMIAKNNEAYEFLKQQIQNRTIEKKYYAIVCGNLDTDTGTITADIGRHPTKPEKMAVVSGAKHSVTHFKVIERFSTHTFVEITLETGRTHQIRVHMSHIGHPIVNDTIYGGSRLPVKTADQVLQAFFLKFISPDDNQEHLVTIDFDSDIIKTLNYLRSKK